MLESENEAARRPKDSIHADATRSGPIRNYIITNQIKNVSIDLQETVRLPPRNLDGDHASTYV